MWIKSDPMDEWLIVYKMIGGTKLLFHCNTSVVQLVYSFALETLPIVHFINTSLEWFIVNDIPDVESDTI